MSISNRLSQVAQPGVAMQNRAEPSDELVVYTHGKAGSKALVSALEKSTSRRVWDVQAATRRSADNHLRVKNGNASKVSSEDAHFLELVASQPEIRLQTISTSRNPVEAAISSFFHNFSARFPDEDINNIDDPEISTRIEAGQGFSEPSYHLDWFDAEFRAFTGIDPYRFGAFDRQLRVRSHTICSGPGGLSYSVAVDALIIRLEDMDNIVPAVLSDFLGINIASVNRVNTADCSPYADRYRTFREKGKFQEHWLRSQLDSRYARFFYSEPERRECQKRWS